MFSHLFCFIVFALISGQSQAGTFEIDYTNHQFLKDGKPFRYISGSFHYMRAHPDQWNDRLQRIRALGLNAIQAVIPWNLHEPTQGNFDFSGVANLSQFLTLAQQNELYVLLRPGPYICAEWEYGGLPWWLLKYDGIKMRQSNKIFLDAVQKYFDVLLDVIKPFLYKNGGPVLMLQIENEYGLVGACDHNYTAFLRDLMWSKLGNDVVLYTVDGQRFPCGIVPGALPTLDFGLTNDTRIDNYFTEIKKFNNGGPVVVSEIWVYYYTKWGDTNVPHGNPPEVVNNVDYMYSKNASINFYMIYGGTNFGFMDGATANGGPAMTTSYDYGAPISENGDITKTYEAVYSWIGNLTGWIQPQKQIPSNNPASNYGSVTLTQIGTNLISTLTRIQEPCTSSQDPLTFEQIDHGYGFVLYSTTLKTGGKTLSTPNIRDYGYVYVNNVYQGMLSRDNQTAITISAQQGDLLRLLVENRGREKIGIATYDEPDYKGLFNNVSLDGTTLQNWFQCGINLTKASVDSLTKTHFKENHENQPVPVKASTSPGVYVGQFTASQLTDTFFNSTGWNKGVLFINGYNLGRYWPVAGPQITLYIPKPYIQQTNTVLLIELVGGQQNYANFVDHVVWK